MSRALTKEEMRREFLLHLKHLVDYWEEVGSDPKEQLDGLAFSTLVMLDGMASLPAFDLVPSPHPDDEDYCKSQGENYWVSEPINDDVMLHDMWYRNEEIQ